MQTILSCLQTCVTFRTPVDSIEPLQIALTPSSRFWQVDDEDLGLHLIAEERPAYYLTDLAFTRVSSCRRTERK